MKSKRNILMSLIALIITLIFMYFIFAFITIELNCFNWQEEYRIIYVIFSLSMWMILTAIWIALFNE